MNSTSIRRRVIPAVAALALALSVTACGAGNESEAGGGSGDGEAVTLDGGGATSQAKAQGVWRANYQDESGNTVNYEEVGSGTGRENFNSGAYTFAGSDSYMDDDEGELSAAKESAADRPDRGAGVRQPDRRGVQRRGRRLPEHVGRDHRQRLQRHHHQVERRRDRRRQPRRRPARHRDRDHPPLRRLGHHDQLHRLPVQGQQRRLGDRVRRPVARGPDERPGPRGHVRRHRRHHRHRGAIGYADDSAVKDTDLGVVSIGVGDSFNAPSAEGAAMVVANSPRAEGRPDVDMAIDIDRTITDAGAYPLLLTSYLIACQTYDDEATATAVKDYLAYVVSTEGQQAAADEAGSAPLDASLQEEAAGIVDKIAAS